MTAEAPGHTLNATAPVHEAYLRLVGDQSFDSQAHFFAAADEAMWRIRVEAARRKLGPKRGGQLKQCVLDLEQPADTDQFEQRVDLDDALTQLEAIEPRAAEVVTLRYIAAPREEATAKVRLIERH